MQANKITSIITNANGIATSGLLDYNTYFVKESTAPDKYTVKVEVSDNIGVVENGKIYEITISNTRVKGTVSISKEDTKTGKQPQGEATLEGAIYGVYARNTIYDPADNSVKYNANAKIGELVTDENEIKQMIYNIISSVDIQQSGQKAVMGAVMPRLKGKVDMKIANQIITDMFKRN